MSQSITLDELDRVGREVDLSDETASALSATVLPSDVVTASVIFVVATPVRHAVRSAASALSSAMPPRSCWSASMYRETRTEYAVLSPDTTPPLSASSGLDGVPIDSSSDMSTEIVLVAGQYDAGGLGRASGQPSASPASRLSLGGSAGENSVSSASNTAFTDSSLTAQSPL